ATPPPGDSIAAPERTARPPVRRAPPCPTFGESVSPRRPIDSSKPPALAVLAARRKESIMAVQLGSVAPDVTQESTEGKIEFHKWIGDKWAVLFSHPKDFTPVCTTELGLVAKLKPQFEKRNCKVLALSVDDVASHKGWIGDIEDTQKTKMNFPILADPDRKVSSLYDMIHPQANDT